MRWLRRWGCRHLRRDDNALASEALLEWADEWQAKLPAPGVTLDRLGDGALDALAAAYAALAEHPAGFRAGRREPIPVRFGATAAAKALYALRPDACPPWDEPIRAHFGWDGSAASYRAALDRAESSPPRLVDEHDWLRITRGHEPPAPEEIERWRRSTG